MTQARWRLAVAVVAVAWGSVAVIVRAVELPATAIAFWRVAIALVALGAAGALVRGRGLLDARDRRRPLLLLGALLGVHWLLYFETIKLSSVALAVLLVYTGPLAIAALAPRLLGARTGPATWAAVVVGAAGVAVVATDGAASIHVTGPALATGLAAGITYALLIIVARALAPTVAPTAFVFWEMAAATALLLPVALTARILPPDAASLAGVLALGVGVTAITGAAFTLALRHVEAQVAGVLAYMEPVSSVLLAWLALGEQPSLRTLAGGGLVLAAGAATVWRAPPGEAGAEARRAPSRTARGAASLRP